MGFMVSRSHLNGWTYSVLGFDRARPIRPGCSARRDDLRSAVHSDADQDRRARGQLAGYSDLRAEDAGTIRRLGARGSRGRSRRADHGASTRCGFTLEVVS